MKAPFAVRLLVLLAAIMAVLASPGVRAEPVQNVVIRSGESMPEVFLDHGVFLHDRQSRLTTEEAVAAARAGEFVASSDPAMADWQRLDKLWMAVELTAQLDQGEQPETWVLGAEHLVYTPVSMDIVRQDGTIVSLLTTDSTTQNQLFTFSASDEFLLSDGETVLALAAIQPGVPLVYGDFGIHKLPAKAREQVVQAGWQAALTLGLVFCAISLLLITPISGNWIGTALAIGYSSFVVQANIETFMRAAKFDPVSTHGAWSAVVAFNVAWGFAMFGYAFRKDLPRLSKAALVFAAVFVVGFLLDWIMNGQPRDGLAFNLFWVSVILFVLVMGFKLPLARGLRRFGLVVFITVILVNFANTMLWQWLDFSDPVAEAIEDYSMLLVGLCFYVLVVTDILRSRRERQALYDEHITALEAQAQSDRRLLETERQYARARDMASRRKRQLQSAGHDIRQPLGGLRAALRQEAGGISDQLQERLHDAIDYLEKLTREYGESEEPRIADDELAMLAEEETEEYALGIVLSAVNDMFASEAQAAGIALEVAATDCRTSVPALALMRAVSNLVANAIRHGDASKVEVAVEHKDGCIITIADDGCGMDMITLGDVKQAGRKGASSDGEGLGLAIVSDLAVRHGFTFDLQSAEGGGTTARIILPPA